MKRHAAIAMLVLGLTAGVSAVHAADYIPLPPEEPVEYVPAGGWYIRGDVGYVFKSHTDGDWDFYNQFPGVEGIDDSYRYDSLEMGDAASFGAGVGYRFTDYFRADATVDYFNADVSGHTQCPYMIKNDPEHHLPQGGDCRYEDDSEADVWTVMANAYVDLPFAVGPVNPYIGAGLGATYIDYDKLKNQENCGDCDESYTNYYGEHDGKSDWRFASSLMAGVTFDLTQQLALDTGYRFTHVWDGDAFGYDDADKSFGAKGTQTRDNGYDFHTIRAGLRYSFY